MSSDSFGRDTPTRDAQYPSSSYKSPQVYLAKDLTTSLRSIGPDGFINEYLADTTHFDSSRCEEHDDDGGGGGGVDGSQ